MYRPGESNGIVDALTQRPADIPEGGDEMLRIMRQLVLELQNLLEQLDLLVYSPLIEGHDRIANICKEPCVIDSLPGRYWIPFKQIVN